MGPRELITNFREKAKMFDYEGWVETAIDYENAANMIEHLLESRNDWQLIANSWRNAYEDLLERLE